MGIGEDDHPAPVLGHFTPHPLLGRPLPPDVLLEFAHNADGTPEAPLGCFDGKIVALYAASPGAMGGIRVLPELRRLLANIKCVVLPDQFALGKAHEAFDDAGRLKEPKSDAFAKDVAERLVVMCRKVYG